MAEKTIAVRLAPELEREGRGLCDPEESRNGEVITPLNYGAQGYLRVYPSGFIRAQIQAGTLIRVPEGKVIEAGEEREGASGGKRPRPARRSQGGKR